MATVEKKASLQEVVRASLEEAKKKALKGKEEVKDRGEDGGEDGGEEDEDGEAGEKNFPFKKGEKKECDESVNEDTTASNSIKAHSTGASSKIGMMTSMLTHMNGLSKSDMTDFFNKVMDLYGPNKDHGVGDKAGSNESSLDMHASAAVGKSAPKTKYPMPKLDVKEDVEEMFAGNDLSEDFKDKASTLFEAAVNARLIAEVTRLEEEYASMVEEQLKQFNEDLTSKVDQYLDYVVENWIEENQVAIESTLRNEVTSDFIDGLKNLFAEHYIDLPEERVDVVESLAEKVSELEAKLNETVEENIALKSLAEEKEEQLNTVMYEQKLTSIIEEMTEGLAVSQQEKFLSLIEGIEFDGDVDTYTNKLNIIKENYFGKTAASSNFEEETFEGDVDNKTVNIDPNVNRYVQALQRTIKK